MVFRNDTEVSSSAQLRFVDQVLRVKLNRLKVDYNCLATLPETVCSELDKETHVRVEQTADISPTSTEAA